MGPFDNNKITNNLLTLEFSHDFSKPPPAFAQDFSKPPPACVLSDKIPPGLTENNIPDKNNERENNIIENFTFLPDLMTDKSVSEYGVGGEDKIMGDISFIDKDNTIIEGIVNIKDIPNDDDKDQKSYILKRFLSEMNKGKEGANENKSKRGANENKSKEGASNKYKLIDNTIKMGPVKKYCNTSNQEEDLSTTDYYTHTQKDVNEDINDLIDVLSTEGSSSPGGAISCIKTPFLLNILKNKIVLIMIIISMFLIKSLPIAAIVPVIIFSMSLMSVKISYDKPFLPESMSNKKINAKSGEQINKIKTKERDFKNNDMPHKVKIVETRIGITTKITFPMFFAGTFMQPEIDSGAAVNVISIDLARQLCSNLDDLRDTTEYHLFDVSNNPIPVIYAKLLRAHIKGYGDIFLPVHIINSENIFLLGRQFMLKHQLMLEIRGRRVIISLRAGFIRNPKLVNIDKVHINPGEKIESAFKTHGLYHDSIFCLYKGNNDKVRLEYKVYRNKNGKYVTVAIRNIGDIPLHLAPGGLILNAIPVTLLKKDYNKPNIVDELNRDKAFINFCSNQSISNTIVRDKIKNKKKVEKGHIMGLSDRIKMIKDQIKRSLKNNGHYFINDFPNVYGYMSRSIDDFVYIFNLSIAVILNNNNWRTELRKNLTYKVNKLILYYNLSIKKLNSKVEKSYGKNFINKAMINSISVGSCDQFIDNKDNNINKDNIEEVTMAQLKDRMTEGQDGISLDAPLPYPRLTLEQISEKLSNIEDPIVRNKVAKILFKHDNAASHTYDVGKSLTKLDFPLPDKIPHNTKVYNLNMQDTMHLFHFIMLCQEQGIVEPSPSHLQFGSPCFMTSRKNPQESPRIVIDARAINSNINYNTASITLDPLQTLQNLLPHVRYGSFVDVKNAFYNLELADNIVNSGITNIVTSFGVFRFRRALTGYAGTPALLLSYILSNIHLNEDNILDIIDLLIIFFDDLSLFSYVNESLDSHLAKLDKFLQRMGRLNLKLNLSKCRFCVDLTKETIQVLGFEIGKGKIKIPDKKREFIQQLKSPRNLKDLQSLLGNLTYFRPLFTLNIHRIVNELYGQVRNFSWDQKAENNFQAIKYFLKQDCAIDQNYGHDVQFLYTDASERALGGALLGLRVADMLPQLYPPTRKIEDINFLNYFEEGTDVGILFEEKNYLKLFFEISRFLNIDKYTKDYNTWYRRFIMLPMSVIEYKNLLNLQDRDKDDLLTHEEIKENYLNFCNSLFNQNNSVDSPDVFSYFARAFSLYARRKINIIYRKYNSEEVISTAILSPTPLGNQSEINIMFTGQIYKYIVIKNTEKNENEVDTLNYSKTICNIDLLDRDLFTLVERALRMTPSKMKDRVSVLGYYSKAVGESVMKTSAIVYLELLAIFESLSYFDTQIKNTKTLVLTDNATAVKILNNKKIEAKKSKLDILSQRVLFWYGNSISFITVTTKEQVADFITRLLPGREESLNFAEPLKPLYEGSLFKIFQPTPLKRSREGFIKNMIAIKTERMIHLQKLNINAITRGRTDAIMNAWDDLNPKKKNKRKGKIIQNDIVNPSQGSEKIEVKNGSIKDQPNIDYPILDKVSKDQPNIDYPILDKVSKDQPNIDYPISDKLSKDQPNIDNPILDKVAKDVLSQKEIDENDFMNYQAPPNGPIVFNNFLPDMEKDSESELSLFHSENKLGLKENIAHIDKELNRKRSDEELEKMKGNIVETFLEELENQEIIPINPKNLSKSQSSKNKLITSRNPLLPNAYKTDKILNRYVFIHFQIKENLVEDINPLTMKYFQGKLILPQILYSLIAVIMHGGLVHCGTEKLYNNINQIYYMKSKGEMKKIIMGIVKSCLTCLKSKNTNFALIKGTSIHAGNFFRNRVVALDLLEFPKFLKGEQSVDGIQAILVFMDVSTQYISTHLLRQTDGRAIRHGIGQYLTIHGLVKYFYADNGSNIRSIENVKFLNSVGARFLDSAPYRSASRGNMENRIRIVQNVIRICSSHKDSVRILTSIAFSIFAINTTKLLNSPLSPFNLHYLSLYNFSGDIVSEESLFEAKFIFDINSLSERFEEKKPIFLELYNKTKNIILKRQEKIIERQNKNRKHHDFQLNDLVLLKNDAKKQEKFFKNKPLYDLYIWQVIKVRKFLINIKNLVTDQHHIASVQQLKKINQDSIGLYKLPKNVAQFFKLLTVEDLEYYNEKVKRDIELQKEIIDKIGENSQILESLTDTNQTDPKTDILSEVTSMDV